MGMEKIRLLLADDHKIIRDGIVALLEDVEHIEIVGEAKNGRELIAQLIDNPADVVLMDINMPIMGGIEATEEITKRFPEVRILALSMYNEKSFITKMLHAGAAGYVLKNVGKEELVLAIETVRQGKSYFSEEVSMAMMSSFMSKKPSNAPVTFSPEITLTKREIEVLRLIAQEMTNSEIADKIFVSPRTVDTHRRNLLQKIGAKNTAGLVRYALTSGILDNPNSEVA